MASPPWHRPAALLPFWLERYPSLVQALVLHHGTSDSFKQPLEKLCLSLHALLKIAAVCSCMKTHAVAKDAGHTGRGSILRVQNPSIKGDALIHTSYPSHALGYIP